MTVISRERKAWLVDRLRSLYHDDDLLVERYLTAHGLVLAPDLVVRVSDQGAGKDPVFSVEAECPVCSGGLTQYQVRASTQRVEVNSFQVPISSTGVSGYVGINPIMYEVDACYRCLFVSAIRTDFKSKSKHKPSQRPIELSDSARRDFLATRDERADCLGGMEPESVFGRPRDVCSTIRAYEMAILCDARKAEHGLAGAGFRLASNRFRIATLHDLIRDPEEADSAVAVAVAEMEKAFTESEAPALAAPAGYLILAGAIRLEDESLASKYFQVLREMSRKLGGAPGERAAQRWCKLGGDLWADWRDAN